MSRRPTLRELQLEELEEYEPETDSETEALQDAFAKGILKPGLNVAVLDRPRSNNVTLMKGLLEELRLELPWIERLDVQSKQAPIPPELDVQIKEAEKGPNPLIYDELKRESVFYRQAQDAVMSVFPRLKELGLRTQRPGDYFAEMVKTDDHMQKVKAQAIKKKLVMERVEKLREIRAQKKVQKAVNAQAKVAKVNSKRHMLEQVKKYKKGETKSLAFLEPGYKPKAQPINTKSLKRRHTKDAKFGRGGKKRGLKRNTRDSTGGIEKKVTKNPNFRSAGKSKNLKPTKRPGKTVRHKLKSKK